MPSIEASAFFATRKVSHKKGYPCFTNTAKRSVNSKQKTPGLPKSLKSTMNLMISIEKATNGEVSLADMEIEALKKRSSNSKMKRTV